MSRTLILFAALAATVACTAAARPGDDAAMPVKDLSETDLLGEPLPEPAPAPLDDAIAAPPPATPRAVIERAAAPAYQPYLSCDLVATRTAYGVRIEALAHAGDGVFDTVDYDLTVTKDGAGGSSDIVQGGAVDLSGGETATLGVAEFNLERNGRYRAELILRDADGVVCEAEARS